MEAEGFGLSWGQRGTLLPLLQVRGSMAGSQNGGLSTVMPSWPGSKELFAVRLFTFSLGIADSNATSQTVFEILFDFKRSLLSCSIRAHGPGSAVL